MPVATVASSTPLTAMRADYNEHSKGQRRVLDLAIPYIAKGIAIHNAKLPSEGPLIFADFGSSTGANSSAAISEIVQQFRQKYGLEQTRSIIAVHEDLPANNWTVLFNYMDEGEESYMKKHEGVFPVGIGRNFVNRILPENCLHFGFSNVALHWLSNMPTKITNHCLPWRGTKEERDLFKRQSDEDWRNFLSARSKELVPGGVLVVSVLSEDEVWMDRVGEFLYQVILRLRDLGDVTDQEVIDFNVRIYRRSFADVTDRTLWDQFGFELVAAENAPAIAHPEVEEFLKHRNVDKWASEFTAMIMSAFEPAFLQALSDSRNDDEKKTVCDKFVRLFIDEITAKMGPEMFEQFTQTSGLIFLVLQKKRD